MLDAFLGTLDRYPLADLVVRRFSTPWTDAAARWVENELHREPLRC